MDHGGTVSATTRAQHEDPALSEEEFVRALSARPLDGPLRARFARTLLKAGRFSEALVQIESALRAAPDEPRVHFDRGVILEALDRRAEALAAHERAIQLKPDEARFRARAAALLEAAGRRAEAAAALEKAIALEPANAVLHTNLGVLYGEMGRRDDARRAFRRAVDIEPGGVEAWLNLASMELEERRLEDALQLLDRARLHVPDDPLIVFYRSLVLLRKGVYGEAADGFRVYLRSHPRDVRALYHLGTALIRSSDVDGAIAAFTDAVRIQPDNRRTWYQLGIAWDRKGMPAEARKAYRRSGSAGRPAPDDSGGADGARQASAGGH